MTKRLLVLFLVSGAVSFFDMVSYVTSNSLGRNFQNCLFDQTQGIFYATTESLSGQPGIIQSAAPVGSAVPSVKAFNSGTVGLGYRDLVMVNDKTDTLPVTLAATLLDSGSGLYNRFVVTHVSAYAVSDIVQDDLTIMGTTEPYGLQAVTAPYYGHSDSEILSLAATTNAVFSLTHRIRNSHLLLPGSALNVHGVTVGASTIAIQSSANAFQKSFDSRDFVVGTGSTQVYDASSSAHLCYNDNLKTLYCAPKWITGNSNGTGVTSVAAYRFDSTALTLSSLSLVTSTSGMYGVGDLNDTTTQNIVGVTGFSKTLSVHQMGVMHTSTNKYYIIVLGGHGAVTATGNNAYALPLVGPDGDYPGALANVTSTAHNTRADDASHLYTAASLPALIGGGSLPWAAGDSGYTMVVVDDTVYVSVNDATVTTPGIYYSQAQFDNYGNIARWGSWNLATPRALGSAAGGGNNQGGVFKFAVNTVSGKIWVVPSDNTEIVNVPSWTQGVVINRSRRIGGVTRGVIDANQSPQEELFNTITKIKANYDWKVLDAGGNIVTLSVYVGTGITDGKGKIVVIRSTNDDLTTTDANFKIIDTPTSVDQILSVSFLQSPSNGHPTGMLLLGTQTGLYAYLDEAHHGGVVDTTAANVHDLSAGYWTNVNTWQQVQPSLFNQNIASIDSLYKDLYITLRAIEQGEEDRIMRMALGDISTNTIHLASPHIICEPTPEAPFFLNNIVLPVEQDLTREQLVIGTYAGAFAVTGPTGMQNATDSSATVITPISGTEEHRISGISRTSDTEVRFVGQTTTNDNSDVRLYTGASSGSMTTAVTSSSTTTPTAGSASTTTGSGTSGSQIWTDGARTLSIASNLLISQDGSTSYEKISALESAAFSGKTLQSISIIGGVITVTTATGAVSLK